MYDDERAHTAVSGGRKRRITLTRDDVVQPHNVEAEQAVLGAMMLSAKAAIWGTEHLGPEDFYRDAHVAIFVAMQHLMDHKVNVDLVTVADYFRVRGTIEDIGGAVYVSQLASAEMVGSNIEYYAGILTNDRIRRETLRIADAMVVQVVAGDLRGPALLDEAEGWLLQVKRPDREDDLIMAKHRVTAMFSDLEARIARKGALPGLDTGIDPINDMLGGLHAEDLTIIAARPSIGKTALACNISIALAQHFQRLDARKAVGFFSLEMSRTQLEYRFISKLSKVMLFRLLHARELYPVEQEAAHTAITTFGELPIAIDGTGSLTVEALRSKARRMMAEHGLGAIVVDYIQLMESSTATKKDIRTVQLAHSSRRLKLLAKELKIPIVMLSQLSRASEGREDKRPQLADLRESGALEQDADNVLLLHRSTKESGPGGPMEIIVAKQRNGPTGILHVYFDRESQDFRSLTPTELALAESRNDAAAQMDEPVTRAKRGASPRPRSMGLDYDAAEADA